MIENSCVLRVSPAPAQSVGVASSRPRTLVLIGAPGSGKTELLSALAAQGEQVLDLERLASHRGSAFGSLGATQPSHARFQTAVRRAVAAVDPNRPLWIEQEGRFIGSVGVPPDLAQQWKASAAIALEVPRERRLARLVEMYSPLGVPALLAATTAIAPRLGAERSAAVSELLYRGALEEAASVLLTYYDAAYDAQRMERRGSLCATVEVGEACCACVARAIRNLVTAA